MLKAALRITALDLFSENPLTACPLTTRRRRRPALPNACPGDPANHADYADCDGG